MGIAKKNHNTKQQQTPTKQKPENTKTGRVHKIE